MENVKTLQEMEPCKTQRPWMKASKKKQSAQAGSPWLSRWGLLESSLQGNSEQVVSSRLHHHGQFYLRDSSTSTMDLQLSYGKYLESTEHLCFGELTHILFPLEKGATVQIDKISRGQKLLHNSMCRSLQTTYYTSCISQLFTNTMNTWDNSIYKKKNVVHTQFGSTSPKFSSSIGLESGDIGGDHSRLHV